MSKNIGFIYFDELHHIHHFLSPAIELSKKEGYEVEILTYQNKHKYLLELIDKLGGDKLKITRLNTYLHRKIIETIKKRNQPSALYIYQKHIKKLLKYDALIFTDHTIAHILKKRGVNKYPKLIYIDHGAGDRAYGYKESHGLFDLILVAGKKKTIRLRKELNTINLPLKITGYNKFDLVKEAFNKKSIFNNKNPTVIYCPHFSPESSSWYNLGIAILDFFVENPQYNLIFAPHFNLFNKKGHGKTNFIKQKYYNAPNIHIDLGSTKSIDMTYILNSDIYLSDVSSQVYEFMFKTRPVIFLNTHNVNWQEDENYLMWHSGKIVKSICELEESLLTVSDWAPKFEDKQKELFDFTFDTNEEKSGARTAALIEISLKE